MNSDCKWALAYLTTADLALSTSLTLIEHAGRRLHAAAAADPAQLLGWLGPMHFDDAGKHLLCILFVRNQLNCVYFSLFVSF